jgi:hypothetical protein
MVRLSEWWGGNATPGARVLCADPQKDALGRVLMRFSKAAASVPPARGIDAFEQL